MVWRNIFLNQSIIWGKKHFVFPSVFWFLNNITIQLLMWLNFLISCFRSKMLSMSEVQGWCWACESFRAGTEHAEVQGWCWACQRCRPGTEHVRGAGLALSMQSCRAGTEAEMHILKWDTVKCDLNLKIRKCWNLWISSPWPSVSLGQI